MKPTRKSPTKLPAKSHVLAFGAHPDDIEFGCGGVIAREIESGRKAHLVICSRGEAGTNGTPEQRIAEAQKAAEILGATVEFIEFDGDAHLEVRATHALRLAEIIRRVRPAIILAPSLVQNQHPDHWRLGQLVRDAARLARYGGLGELKGTASHRIGQLFFYALSPDSEPGNITPVLIDVSEDGVLSTWARAMRAHASQMKTRDYAGLQLARAKVHGSRCGVEAAIPLFPNDPLVFDSLETISRGARHF